MMKQLLVALALGACGKGEDAVPAAGSAGSGIAAVAPGGAGSAIAGSATPVAMTPPADAAPPAPSSKIAAARCGEPCLFLVDTPIEKLAESYQAACGTPMKEVGFTDCKQLDYVRNCIYAAHGLVYKQKRWQKRFAAKPWYEPHPDANAKTLLSPGELANVHELHTRSKACKKSIAVSGADYERLQHWLAGFAKKKPELPKLVSYEDEDVKPKEFTKKLTEELAGGSFTPKLDGAIARYVDQLDDDTEAFEVPNHLRETLRAMSPRPRLIQISFISVNDLADNPISEGAFVFLAYDAKDQLVAVGAKHFFYD